MEGEDSSAIVLTRSERLRLVSRPIEFGTGTGKTAIQGRIAELSMEGVDFCAIVLTRSERLRLFSRRSESAN
jgi:hypothetical protein